MDNQLPPSSGDPHDLLGSILSHAINKKASDIHIEPSPEGLSIRFRIDGSLILYQVFETRFQDQLISRIKILSKLDISEHRLPQDGHFQFQSSDKIYNFRLSVLPTINGEALVLRVLSREENLIKLESLGFDADQYDLVKKLISSPSGLILTTGPTGSGKTTLLYSIINALNTPSRSVITLEDPVELVVFGVRQTQIKEDIGLSFAKVMRSILRQDPNIIMLGEIRDNETALITIQAALSGILIFSTFHTYDMPALVTRFTEMGIYSSVVAQTIKGVLSTRLMRRICGYCSEVYQPTEEEKKILLTAKIHPNITPNFRKGKGCSHCNNLGYLGRIGIFEVIYFDRDIRSAIIERRPVFYIYELLKQKNFKSLRDIALERVNQGYTTTEEFIRVVGSLD